MHFRAVGASWGKESLRDAVWESRSLKRALRGRIRLGKNVSPPLWAVVRGRDEDSVGIEVFRRELRVFSIWTRCALRVTGAHQNGREGKLRRELGEKHSNARGGPDQPPRTRFR